MPQRLTSYMLVILKHEKPFKDLPDVIADRLSKMEGVDGSGVIVSQVTQFEADAMIERAEAEDTARFGGQPVTQPIVRGLSNEERQALIDMTAEDFMRGEPIRAGRLVLQNITADDLMTAGKEGKLVLRSANPSGMSDEDIDKAARVLTQGMGENITT